MADIHIAIEGISGSGKSDLGSLLEKPPLVFNLKRGLPGETHVKFFGERVGENPFLKDFYDGGMKEVYAMASQMYYLNARIVTGANIQRFKGLALEDRSIFGDYIFAKNLHDMDKLSHGAFSTYCDYRDSMMRMYNLNGPDGVIFLDVTVDTCINDRLKRRGTGEALDYDYWGRLIEQYRNEFKAISERIPVIWIDANVDFLSEEDYVDSVSKKANGLIKEILAKRKSEAAQQPLPVVEGTEEAEDTVMVSTSTNASSV
jgi:deoxyadenosine/deoxycytidine kinase